MTYSPRDRQRARNLVTAVTAVATAGSVTSLGWMAGTAAQAHDEEQAAQQAAYQKQQRAYERALARREDVRTVLKERPQRTRVTVRYVTGAGTVPAIGGGTVTSTPTPSSGGSSGGSSGPGGGSSGASSGGSSGSTAPAPPPPPTSSGS